MGMSASQSRLLSLTARLSDLEFEAQAISNEKIRLSTQSQQASTDYQNALDLKKLTVENTAGKQIDATASRLMNYGALGTDGISAKQRIIKDASGKVIVSQAIADAFKNAQSTKLVSTDGTVGERAQSATVLQSYGLTVDDYVEQSSDDTTTTQQKTYLENSYTGAEGFIQQFGYSSNPDMVENTSVKYDATASSWYTEIFNQMQSCGYSIVSDTQLNDSDWLYKNIENGSVFIDEKTATDADGNKTWQDVTLTSDTQLQEEEDSSKIAKAKAKYDSVLAQIESKDSKFDMNLKNIDTEHNAIQTEVESVKKVIDKNIERSFKIFDA